MIGKRLKEARKAAKLTQEELAEIANMDSAASISHYENEIHSPSFHLVCQLAEALDIPECWFYCRDDRLAKMIIDNHQKNKDFYLDPEEILQLKEMGYSLTQLSGLVEKMLYKRSR